MVMTTIVLLACHIFVMNNENKKKGIDDHT